MVLVGFASRIIVTLRSGDRAKERRLDHASILRALEVLRLDLLNFLMAVDVEFTFCLISGVFSDGATRHRACAPHAFT